MPQGHGIATHQTPPLPVLQQAHSLRVAAEQTRQEMAALVPLKTVCPVTNDTSNFSVVHRSESSKKCTLQNLLGRLAMAVQTQDPVFHPDPVQDETESSPVRHRRSKNVHLVRETDEATLAGSLSPATHLQPAVQEKYQSLLRSCRVASNPQYRCSNLGYRGAFSRSHRRNTH